MTSRRCFFRVLREDLRHKIWMLALSTVGSLLALPVAYLIYISERSYYLTKLPQDAALRVLHETACRVETFYGAAICISVGVVAVVGAVIVGLFGFRHVFQKNMTDLYHSLPVSRKTLFLAGWLNGLLIWFVPCLFNLAVTVVLGEYKLAALKKQAELLGNQSWEAWPSGAGLLVETLVSMLTILAAFLLVYHLVLLAVMLCGNILNTLTVTGIIGVGTTVAWLIVILFMQAYLDTYIEPFGAEIHWISLTSPLVSAVFVLYQRFQAFLDGDYYVCIWRVAVSFLMAGALWLLALAVYRRRKSELADQGTAGKAIRFIMQVTVSLAAFHAGWLLFWYITSYSGALQLIWSIFGAVLTGGLVFGALDVIFQMDFKAFFSHKGLLAGVLIAGLLSGLTFRFDWIGYDGYLPEKEEIQEIAIYSDYLGSRQNYRERRMLDDIHIRDREAAYAFLESAVAVRQWDVQSELPVYYTHIDVGVTLKSGRTYYRRYLISSNDSKAVYDLVMTQEYLGACYRISDVDREYLTGISLRRGGIAYEAEKLTGEDRRRIDLLCDAYNRDVEENPEAVVRGEGRLIARIYLSGSRESFQLTVFEGMKNTREALRQAGLAYYADPADTEEVSAIVLSSGVSIRELAEGYDPAGNVREIYGLTDRKGENSGTPAEPGSETAEVRESRNPAAWSEDGIPAAETVSEPLMMDGSVELEITDPEEIEELLELLSYGANRADNIFGNGNQLYGLVTIQEKNGNQYDVYIAKGSLPEKYVLKFEQVKEELLRQMGR